MLIPPAPPAAAALQVTTVHKHSKAYIERHRALGTSMTGLGLALTQLSSCEQPINDSLSKGISHMGLCVGRLSATYSERADREESTFEVSRHVVDEQPHALLAHAVLALFLMAHSLLPPHSLGSGADEALRTAAR